MVATKTQGTRQVTSRVDRWIVPGIFAGVVWFFAVAIIPWRLGVWVAGIKVPRGLALLAVLAGGKAPFSWWCVIFYVLTAGVHVGAGWLWWRYRRGRAGKSEEKERRQKMADAASLMGQIGPGSRVSKAEVEAKGTRLGLPAKACGYWLANAYKGAEQVFMDCEDGLLVICGPRVGKTTSIAVPMICEAPGAVVATSNKRDIVDIPRCYRERNFGRVWVFDPQGIAEEEPSWYWDLLSYVDSTQHAMEIATVFMDCKPGGDEGGNSGHFRETGRNLLAGLMRAASLGGKPITIILDWLTDMSNREALRILKQHGEHRLYATCNGIYNTHPDQRDGYRAEAMSFVEVLMFDESTKWVMPSEGREAFDIEAFVRSGCVDTPGLPRRPQTLFMLSKEGSGACPQYVTALTVAITQTAERLATQCSGGRLDVPLYAVLDEAANVCRWGQLPNMYSHYGSRGIILATILQSYAQGVRVWGKTGMDAMWTAATTKAYGGGVSDIEFLTNLSRAIGEFWTTHVSTSRSSGQMGVSTSSQVSKEDILTASELASLPRGTMVVLASGERPLLVKTVPFWKREYGEELKKKPAGAAPVKASVEQVSSQAGEQEVVEVDRVHSGFTPHLGIRQVSKAGKE